MKRKTRDLLLKIAAIVVMLLMLLSGFFVMFY